MNRAGFSLIEMLAVLTLMALIALMASVRWNEPYQAARFQSIAERIVDTDMKARRHAMAMRKPCQIVFDMERNQIQSSRWVEGKEKLTGFKLGTGIELVELQTPAGLKETKVAVVNIGADGSGGTYAVHVRQTDKARWMVFAGRTGQPYFFEKQSDVETLFKNLRVQGADAD